MSASTIYTLSLHDALPISARRLLGSRERDAGAPGWTAGGAADRKSTRLNSSHTVNSYAVLCLKKKTRPGGSEPLMWLSTPGRSPMRRGGIRYENRPVTSQRCKDCAFDR